VLHGTITMNSVIDASACKRGNSSSVSAVTGGASPIHPFPTGDCGCQGLDFKHCRQKLTRQTLQPPLGTSAG
jgi:hypothetical protein